MLMLFLILYLFVGVVMLGAGIYAALSDFKSMTIPNMTGVIITICFFLAYFIADFADVDAFGALKAHMLAAFIMFMLTFLLYILKVFGGGDSKLIVAFAFWVGLAGLVDFLFICALLGACAGLFALLIKRVKPLKTPAEHSWIGRVQSGQSVVAYGIPIVLAAFSVLFLHGALSVDVLRAFLL